MNIMEHLSIAVSICQTISGTLSSFQTLKVYAIEIGRKQMCNCF